MTETMGDKVAKLPVWAREHIADLLRRIAVLTDHPKELRQQVASLQDTVKRLKNRLSIAEHILRCADRGGHETAG